MGGKSDNGRRVRREEIPALVMDFRVYAGITAPFLICGSYRRGKPDCGDIEIVFLAEDKSGVRLAISQLFGTTADYGPIMHGPFRGVQFDLFIANTQEWGSMILHATGSGKFNMLMRARAKERGYKLNQYGLWERTSEGDRRVIGGESELDYFAGLGMRYVKPEDRSI